ncbi:putative pentatricopeptide repeat-containing protein At3g18840 [Eucalyptus grandis]|uniref:putative pentatricopeptide repeat-containing protein At3g18840 n=1 Tax=Eucalyptus grandis TaxID=71139 RepID=UPI00192EE840|nr:putative pentatricopeptide repeat-containing protein At3g18840 [Eucalyptus grandis]
MQLMRDRLKFDEFTLTAMLNLVAKLRVQCYGTQLHAYMVRTGNDTDKYVMSSLIDMYSKCGSFGEAYRVFCESKAEVDLVSKNMMMAACCREGKMEVALDLFQRLPELNDTVSWNTLSSGYAQNGFEEESLNFFMKMRDAGFGWNEHLFASVLNACSSMRNSKLGKEIHAWVLREGVISNLFVKSALVDVYCKCGNMKHADLVYVTIECENSFSTTSMIMGHSSRGALDPGTQIHAYSLRKGMEMEEKLISATIDMHEDQAMKLYKEMLERGLKPDEVTFMALLSACRHSGLVEMGEKYFKSTVEDYKIVPETDHYACMIDLYGRANQLEKAMDIMKKIPRNLDPLANVFAAEENWAEMCKIREKMRGKETKKLAGCSWVYLENGILAFTSGDTPHSKAEVIYSILEFLSADLRALPNSSVGKVNLLKSTLVMLPVNTDIIKQVRNLNAQFSENGRTRKEDPLCGRRLIACSWDFAGLSTVCQASHLNLQGLPAYMMAKIFKKLLSRRSL